MLFIYFFLERLSFLFFSCPSCTLHCCFRNLLAFLKPFPLDFYLFHDTCRQAWTRQGRNLKKNKKGEKHRNNLEQCPHYTQNKLDDMNEILYDEQKKLNGMNNELTNNFQQRPHDRKYNSFTGSICNSRNFV